MSSLPTRGSRAAKPHQRKPYERPPPSPAPLARSKSSFFNTVKSIVTAPIAWLSGGDVSSPSAANGAAGEGKPLKRRASKNRVDGGEGSRPKRMRTISPPRASASGYLDPPDHMLRHTISAATFARATGLKSVFSNGDTARPSIRDTPLHFNSLQRAKSPSRRTPSLGPWFPQPASTRNSLAPRPSQVHFDALPHLNIDAAIAAHDDSRMLSPSPSVGHGVAVGLGRERTPSRALPGREPSVSLSRVSVSRATGASIRASLSASNPFASLGKSSSVAPERKKSSLIWDDTLGVTKADTNEPKGTPAPAAKNTAERLLNALENMHTHTGDAQRPRRRPPPSVQVPTPGPSVPSKLKRMIQPYGEVKLSPKAKSKGTQGRPMSGLMKILMKNKKDSEAEEMEVEESSKPAEATKPIDAPKPAEKSEKVVEKPKEADKADKTGDVDMESQSNSAPATSPALKVIDNFRPVSQPPSRPGSSLRHSKSITKRAHAPSAGRNRFSANNEDEEEDEEAAERRNAELVAVANASVFKVPEGFKFGVSATPALPTPKPVEQTKPDSTMNVISPKPVPAKTTPNPILSFTPIAVPKSDDPPPKPVFFAGSEGTKTELPKVQNPFAGLGGGFGGKPEVKVPDVPKWGAPPAVPVAPTLAAKPSGEVSVFANIGVSAPAPTAKPASEAKPVFSFGKPAEPAPAPAPEKTNEPAKPLLGSSPFSFGKSNPLPTPASLPTPAPASNPFAGIGVDKSIAAAPAPAPTLFSFGASKPGTPTAPAAAPATPAPAPAFSFGKPAEATTEAPKPVIEAPKPSPSPFSFAPVEKSATPPAAPLSLFGGSSSAVTTAPVPVAPPVSLAPAPFSFGAPATSTPAIATPTPQPAASPFTFGISSTTATAAPAAPEPKKSPFDFSASVASPAPVPAPAQVEAPKKSPFDFSSAPAPAPTTSKSPFDFSSAKPAENPATPFTFGTPNPPPAPATEKKSPFDFSAVPKPAPSPFAFGAPAPAPAPVPTAAAPATTNGFTFGPPAPARPATPPSGGDAAMEESPTREPAKIVTSGFGSGPGFGAQVPSSSFAFGSTNGTNGGSTGPFGAPLNTSTTAQTNGFGSSVAPASPAPFAFGASNGTSSGFGSNGFNTNGNSTPATTPFAFGAGGGFGQPASATASPSNPFNQPAPSNPFGQPNPAPANGFQTPASPFPSATPLANTGFNTNNPGPINTFGSTPAATNGFPSSPAPVNQPSFSFGNNAPNTGTASPATFTFGLPASPATPTATSAPFVFGAGAAPPEQGSPAAGVQFNLGTADASPGGRKIKPLRRPRRN